MAMDKANDPLVHEHQAEHESQWAVIVSIAGMSGDIIN